MSKETHVVTLYELTETELMGAKMLPENTLKMIKNLQATDFMALANLQPDPNNYPAYVQRHAELKGALAAWGTLIDGHNDTVKALNTGE